MLSDNKKIIVWFLACLILTLYAKWSGIVPPSPGTVLGKSTVESAGFGPLLKVK